MTKQTKTTTLPLIPLRGVVAFPGRRITIDIAREKTVKAIETAMAKDNRVVLAPQFDPACEEPTKADIFRFGVIAHVYQAMRLPGGIIRINAEALSRVHIEAFSATEPFFKVRVRVNTDIYVETDELTATVRQLIDAYDDYFKYGSDILAVDYFNFDNAEDANESVYTIASALPYNDNLIALLAEDYLPARMELLMEVLCAETQILKLERKIEERVRANIDEHQEEYYLREQKKVIEEELGEGNEARAEANEYRKKITELSLGEEVSKKLFKEADRVEKFPSTSYDGAVVRTYLDTVLSLPWNTRTEEALDIARVQEILDRDHYGLDTVKDRITEHLAVRILTGKSNQIICLVGPPGVGKTSIAKSVAEALGRKLAQISLGGVHDEADIRGHRKTYVGAMPGRITEALIRAGAKNPLILLDEVDKLGADYKGDPSAALLELLDAEQNSSFRDHYTEVPFDLSEAMFIMTANTTDTISQPLLDRMEVISLPGYTTDERFNIGKRYLIPKTINSAGLKKTQLTITDDALLEIIKGYTREAGVRGLEKQLSKICRKVAKKAVSSDKPTKVKVTARTVSTYLGKKRILPEAMEANNEIGIARGLAWTAVGGETMPIEVNIMNGKGKLELTGQLGDVMKESAQAALSYVRSVSDKLKIDRDFYAIDIHIHVPEGAIPKDGPSAGITIATALASALTNTPVRRDVAMTGEITLRGNVLPIGGLKEKALAAYELGITDIIIPEKNKLDLCDIPKDIADKLNFIPVKTMDKVLRVAFA